MLILSLNGCLSKSFSSVLLDICVFLLSQSGLFLGTFKDHQLRLLLLLLRWLPFLYNLGQLKINLFGIKNSNKIYNFGFWWLLFCVFLGCFWSNLSFFGPECHHHLQEFLLILIILMKKMMVIQDTTLKLLLTWKMNLKNKDKRVKNQFMVTVEVMRNTI